MVLRLIAVCLQVPSVDGEFLPRDPLDLLGDADYLAANDVLSHDVMLGINNNEGGLLETLEDDYRLIRDTKVVAKHKHITIRISQSTSITQYYTMYNGWKIYLYTSER